jgi:hypothetical protein
MPRILVAVDVSDSIDLGTAINIVALMMRKVEWPDTVENVEIGECEEVEVGEEG